MSKLVAFYLPHTLRQALFRIVNLWSINIITSTNLHSKYLFSFIQTDYHLNKDFDAHIESEIRNA